MPADPAVPPEQTGVVAPPAVPLGVRRPAPATCSVCGLTVDGPPPLTWSLSRGERGSSAVCGDCTRRHLRSMEAQLEQEHW